MVAAANGSALYSGSMRFSTWPLGGYVQRIVLFGLLPPITWVMAAAVENLLF